MKKKLLLALLLTAAMLALVAWSFPFDLKEVGKAFSESDKRLALPILLLVFLGQVMRVTRWWLLVRPVKPLSFRRILPPALAGFMSINIFPLRAGEAVRPLLLKTREGMPFSAGLATVLAERVADALSVFLMLLLSLAVIPSFLITLGGHTYDLRFIARVLLYLSLGMAVFLALLMILRGRLVALVEKALGVVSGRLGKMAGHVLGVFVEGLSAFRTPTLALEVAALSAAIWGVQALSMWIGFRMFGFGLSFGAALATLAVTMAGITIPAGIGMSGNFRVFCVAALALYQVPAGPALAYSLVMNLLFFATAVGMGIPVLPGLGARLGQLAAEPVPEGS